MITRIALFLLVATLPGTALKAAPFLVENGAPKAVIVISDDPARMQRLAAEEFRTQIEKISGARLPIVTKKHPDAVNVFIGASAHNPVTAEGLEAGAYRIVSGPDWLSLIGDDRDFEPKHPFARSNGDIPRAQAEWEKIVGAPYGMPSPGLYKNRLRLPGNTGKPDGVEADPREILEIWGLDERGSFNAVCGYLRTLGARWYLPGELGEVLPEMDSISLPDIDETVLPDFPVRQFNFRFSTAGVETSMWAMRLGIRNDNSIQVAHGMATMTNTEGVFARHPEWFALYGGERDFRPGDSKCQLCYSDDGLFEETVRYHRALLDTYQFKAVSVMPPDAYTAICQCEKCEGKDSPDRHERGRLSNHVWDFTNRVAKEIAKTHPDALILNGGYGSYTLPPDNIEKLEPNILVCLVGGRRPMNKAGDKGEGEVAPERLRAAWAEKTQNPILFFENYPFTGRGWFLPAFAPRALVETVNATKGISMGEDIWLTAGRDFDTVDIGFNHFMVYFTARSYWGGKEADGEALFNEYCDLFYGPAAKEMRSFFTYCEDHWKGMANEKELADTALGLFSAAKSKAEPTSVYGERLALIDDFLEGLRMKSARLGQKRGPVPKVRLVGDAYDIVIDGHLDEAYWQQCPTAATGRLSELQTGRVPTFGTTFQSGWDRDGVYFAIRCEEHPGETPIDAATSDDDLAIWKGDAVEILIETESHSYYQIAVSPGGNVVDLDRGASEGNQLKWDSKAEVATRIGEDHWVVEIRIPVTQDENDPLHQVIGRKPTESLPWHINLCRQRIREDGQEFSALSPTATASFHVPIKFAHFYAGRSRSFDADPSVTDFVIGFREALKQRTPEAFLALADLEGATALQRSAALEEVAALLRRDAGPLVDQIPVEAVQKTVQMQHLLASGNATDVVTQFATEAFNQWPFWKRGDGLRHRGSAWFILNEGEKAESDLKAALLWINDPRVRDSVTLTLARNRERNLGNDEAALEAYREIVDGKERPGGADQFYALQGIARIQTKRGDFEAALETLNRARPETLTGTWQKHLLESIAEVEAAREAAR